MNYAIEVLQERLDQLNNAYEKYVTKGDVDPNSWVAIDNKNKAEQIEKAIKIITKNL